MNLFVIFDTFFVINVVCRFNNDRVNASLLRRSAPAIILFCNDIVSIHINEYERSKK
jgi:hypothetical protein